MKQVNYWLWSLTFIVFFGCSTPTPDLKIIYNRAAQYESPDRNPVILIPGILGSRLVERSSGKVVWGAFSGDYVDPSNPEEARIFALPLESYTSQMTAQVEPDGVLDSVKVDLLGLTLSTAAYVEILKTLGLGGYRDEEIGLSGAIDYGTDHFTCFQFPYDWRKSNDENAAHLYDFVIEKQKYVAQKIKERYGVDKEVKFDIVAHSMGGLITRYFLRYGKQTLTSQDKPPTITWEGAKLVDKAIIVGTPNAGSAKAIRELAQGIQYSFVLPKYPAALLGTFPSIYQLFPRVRHQPLFVDNKPVDFFDENTWIRLRWGLANPKEDVHLKKLMPNTSRETRKTAALATLRKNLRLAQRFHQALDIPAKPPKGLELHAFLGDAISTIASLDVDPQDGDIDIRSKDFGDGTVLRTSVLMDERVGQKWEATLVSPITWSNVNFVFREHLELTKDLQFVDNLLYLLLERPKSRDDS